MGLKKYYFSKNIMFKEKIGLKLKLKKYKNIGFQAKIWKENTFLKLKINVSKPKIKRKIGLKT